MSDTPNVRKLTLWRVHGQDCQQGAIGLPEEFLIDVLADNRHSAWQEAWNQRNALGRAWHFSTRSIVAVA